MEYINPFFSVYSTNAQMNEDGGAPFMPALST